MSRQSLAARLTNFSRDQREAFHRYVARYGALHNLTPERVGEAVKRGILDDIRDERWPRCLPLKPKNPKAGK